MPDPIDYIDEVDDEDTLVDLLDRVLDVGVVVVGDIKLSLANVDLIYVGLKLFIGSMGAYERLAHDRAEKIEGSPA